MEKQKRRIKPKSISTSGSDVAYPTDPATLYALDVGAGRVLAGPHVRAACKRHLYDLRTASKRNLTWDIPAAMRALDYFPDVLRLNGGDFEGKPFILEPFEAFIVGLLFGWKRADGSRRFRTAYIEIGKGNGKSPLAAGIGLYMLTADGESRAEVYAGATKKDQAMVLFRDAVAMVDQSPALARRIKQSGKAPTVWNLAYLETASFFRPIGKDDRGRGQSGPRPHCALLDEVHEHPTNAMVDMMDAGTKGRRQPLIVLITNSGVDRTSVCWENHDYGVKVCNGDLEDDSYFAYICALDPKDEPFDDEACWIKANPAVGVTIKYEYLREQVRKARGMPAKESLVRRLNFCQWVDAENPWIDGNLWRACSKDEFGVERFRDRRCFGALDLSEVRDLTAFALVAEPDENDIIDAMLFYWTPKETLLERAHKDRVPYDVWVERGHLLTTEGRTVDYGFVGQFISEEILTSLELVGLAYDQWRFKEFVRELDDIGVEWFLHETTGSNEDRIPNDGAGIRLVRHGQGAGGGGNDSILWMPRSVSELENRVVNGKLHVANNPVLTWNSASAVLEQDRAGSKTWTKRKSTGRIDGIVALSMAVGLMATAKDWPRDSGIRISLY